MTTNDDNTVALTKNDRLIIRLRVIIEDVRSQLAEWKVRAAAAEQRLADATPGSRASTVRPSNQWRVCLPPRMDSELHERNET